MPSKGNDFNVNPAGTGPKTKPTDPLSGGTPQQKSGGAGYDINPASVPAGGPNVLEQAKPGAASQKDVGTGSFGSGQKPYKLNGG